MFRLVSALLALLLLITGGCGGSASDPQNLPNETSSEEAQTPPDTSDPGDGDAGSEDDTGGQESTDDGVAGTDPFSLSVVSNANSNKLAIFEDTSTGDRLVLEGGRDEFGAPDTLDQVSFQVVDEDGQLQDFAFVSDPIFSGFVFDDGSRIGYEILDGGILEITVAAPDGTERSTTVELPVGPESDAAANTRALTKLLADQFSSSSQAQSASESSPIGTIPVNVTVQGCDTTRSDVIVQVIAEATTNAGGGLPGVVLDSQRFRLNAIETAELGVFRADIPAVSATGPSPAQQCEAISDQFFEAIDTPLQIVNAVCEAEGVLPGFSEVAIESACIAIAIEISLFNPPAGASLAAACTTVAVGTGLYCNLLNPFLTTENAIDDVVCQGVGAVEDFITPDTEYRYFATAIDGRNPQAKSQTLTGPANGSFADLTIDYCVPEDAPQDDCSAGPEIAEVTVDPADPGPTEDYEVSFDFSFGDECLVGAYVASVDVERGSSAVFVENSSKVVSADEPQYSFVVPRFDVDPGSNPFAEDSISVAIDSESLTTITVPRGCGSTVWPLGTWTQEVTLDGSPCGNLCVSAITVTSDTAGFATDGIPSIRTDFSIPTGFVPGGNFQIEGSQSNGYTSSATGTLSEDGCTFTVTGSDSNGRTGSAIGTYSGSG